jgi:putative membrane protein
MFGFGSFFMILFWIFIIVGFFRIFRHGSCSHMHNFHKAGGSAAEILKERYAKGEITKEEFASMKKDIE